MIDLEYIYSLYKTCFLNKKIYIKGSRMNDGLLHKMKIMIIYYNNFIILYKLNDKPKILKIVKCFIINLHM